MDECGLLSLFELFRCRRGHLLLRPLRLRLLLLLLRLLLRRRRLLLVLRKDLRWYPISTTGCWLYPQD